MFQMEVVMHSENLLTTAAAAKLLSVSQAFLERDRWAGATIPFIRVGSRAVRYRLADLEKFVSSRRSRAPTDASGAAGARPAAQAITV